jgi:hypothetical protein
MKVMLLLLLLLLLLAGHHLELKKYPDKNVT